LRIVSGFEEITALPAEIFDGSETLFVGAAWIKLAGRQTEQINEK